MVDVGDVLAGKYRVERVLGRGGMGYVVSAYHVQLGNHVAVKFMMPELCEREEPVTRFLREARAAVRIRNEHVARVLDVGTLESGAPYMVMEYLEGHDLAEELDKRIQLPTYEAVDYVLQASEAIAEAHALGIVHRDLKPANLFLTRRIDGSPLVKVLDFGISKALIDEEGKPTDSLTATQALIGSPQYMSPEQVRKPKAVDGRSDVWALGVILFELLSGRQPFSADTAMSVLAAVVSDPTPKLRPLRPDVPEELQAAIEKCLEKKPEQRFQTVADLANALEPFAPPAAVPSIQRISATLRPHTPVRLSPETPTESVSGGSKQISPRAPSGSKQPTPSVIELPDAETVQATPDSMPDAASRESLAELRAESKTAAEWGKSTKPGDETRGRRNLVIGGGALVVAAVIATAVVVSRGQAGTPAPETASTPSAADSTVPAASHPASAPPEDASTVVVSPIAPSAVPSVGEPEATRPRPIVRPPAAPHVKPPPAPAPATAKPTSGVPDPLEGRR